MSKEICNWIFEEMQAGSLVYPNEAFGTCDDVVDTIRKSKKYTEKALQGAMERLHIDDTSGAMRKKLENRGYRFVSNIEWCTAERQQELEDNWLKQTKADLQIP